MPRRALFIAALVVCACAPASGQAAQRVAFKLHFVPNRPGGSTTVVSEILVSTSTGRVPSPVTSVSVHLPSGIGLAGSELGLSTCSIAMMEFAGPEHCPANSMIGQGSALSEVPFGPVIVREGASITAYLTQPVEGHTSMLFYADAETPVSAQIIFPAVLLPARKPLGSAFLNTLVPITPTLPLAPDVSVVRIRTVLGPLHLTYYKWVHKRKVPYHPVGILIPAHCPVGGFRFSATLSFLDGSTSTGRSVVPCPR
jgi:hypothetical protein